ncbi:marine proteobacterial sortase target protein [Alteromonas sp. 5E99-2]|uniref:marine proteobacterial sortase target protein n=1 Tax=Alteromonas sp. 5E99-2 TaxID=2817683 RepID=UPI001A9974B9|nr:marine proteobacterial sortase target protein [Alteromonas sp. 5E99-2]MBO1255457.1 marine proteobacterial sortase target protein [Alteromonas sp. 5E99-2]
MTNTLRLLIGACLISSVLAFHYIKPLFAHNTSEASSLKFNVSYESNSVNAPLVRVKDYHFVEQGSFFIEQEGELNYTMSPLLHSHADISITGLIARVKLTQYFSNQSEHLVNGTYVFPLPENAAVDHLTMKIGEREIIGKILAKNQAKAVFDNAKKQGNKASLLVQNRPNIFTNSVANIGPKDHIEVTIEYQQSVRFNEGTFSLRFPNTITPRYFPKHSNENTPSEIGVQGWAASQKISANHSANHNVTMNITLSPGFEIGEISSDIHPIIKTKKDNSTYTISLKNKTTTNDDFVLNWMAKAGSSPTAAHFSQRTEQGQYGAIMLMPPSDEDIDSHLSKEVIYVIDTSGSMEGPSMTQAKQALSFAVNQLSPSDIFNIIQFDSKSETMWTQSQQASAQTKRQATQYISRLRADGGTEILPAMKLALENQYETENRIRQVIFITDGAIGNETELFSYIKNNLSDSRLFTIGIGSAPNSYFMTEAALLGKGTYTYIGSTMQVREKMQALLTKLSQPVLANISIDVPSGVEFYPTNLPDLYKGEPIMLSYFSTTPMDKITVRGNRQNSPWKQALSLQKSAEQTGLNVLWARRKIAQLERDKKAGKNSEEINSEIQRVALANHVVSSMTSLVAVDTQVSNSAQKNKQGTLPQTATPAALQLTISLLFLLVGCGTLTLKRRGELCPT